MIAGRALVDTNILVYAYDLDAGRKRETARALLAGLWESRAGTLSTQVLQEFYVTVTRKLARPLGASAARRLVRTYSAWPVQVVDVGAIVSASEIAEEYQLSFWDALIIAAAGRVGADRIYSEDFQTGQRIAGVLVENPFVV